MLQVVGYRTQARKCSYTNLAQRRCSGPKRRQFRAGHSQTNSCIGTCLLGMALQVCTCIAKPCVQVAIPGKRAFLAHFVESPRKKVRLHNLGPHECSSIFSAVKVRLTISATRSPLFATRIATNLRQSRRSGSKFTSRRLRLVRRRLATADFQRFWSWWPSITLVQDTSGVLSTTIPGSGRTWSSKQERILISYLIPHKAASWIFIEIT